LTEGELQLIRMSAEIYVKNHQRFRSELTVSD
jgi:hypothetical protein